MSRAQEIFPRAILGTPAICSLALEAVGRSGFCIKSIYCITSLLRLFQIRTEEIVNFMCFYHFVPLKEDGVLCYKSPLNILAAIAPVAFPHMVLRKETRSLYYVTAPKNTDETQIIMTVLPTHYFWFHFCWIATFTLPLARSGERCKLMSNGRCKTVTSRITDRQFLQFAHQ